MSKRSKHFWFKCAHCNVGSSIVTFNQTFSDFFKDLSYKKWDKISSSFSNYTTVEKHPLDSPKDNSSRLQLSE